MVVAVQGGTKTSSCGTAAAVAGTTIDHRLSGSAIHHAQPGPRLAGILLEVELAAPHDAVLSRGRGNDRLHRRRLGGSSSSPVALMIPALLAAISSIPSQAQ